VEYVARAKAICSELGIGLRSAIEATPFIDVREGIAAVFLRSRYGDVWLAQDEKVAAELAAEGHGVPILTFAEVQRLLDKSPDALAAILRTKSVFPGARVLQ